VRRLFWLWGGRIVAVGVVIALAVYLYRSGLDKADKIGSSLAVVIALVALIGPYVIPPRKTDEGSTMPDHDERREQSIRNASVDGSLTQADEIGGQLKIVGSKAAAADPEPPPAASGDESSARQSVDGVRVDGHMTQVRSVHGDVTVE
jgi:hypothetical protein